MPCGLRIEIVPWFWGCLELLLFNVSPPGTIIATTTSTSIIADIMNIYLLLINTQRTPALGRKGKSFKNNMTQKYHSQHGLTFRFTIIIKPISFPLSTFHTHWHISWFNEQFNTGSSNLLDSINLSNTESCVYLPPVVEEVGSSN